MKIFKRTNKWWQFRRNRYYRKNRLHLVMDISFIIAIILLLSVSIRLALYHPSVQRFLKDNLINYFIPEEKEDTRELAFEIKNQALKKSVSAKDLLAWSLRIENTGELDIEELKLDWSSFGFDLSLLDFKTKELLVDDNFDLEDLRSGVLIKNLQANNSLVLELEFKYHRTNLNLRQIDLNLKALANSGEKSLSKSLNLEPIKLETDLSLKANLYFHSPQGDQLGIGPIPPIIGLPTKYWLILELENDGNILKDFVFSAKLAKNVSFNEEKSLMAGNYSYDKTQSRLIWKIEEVAAKSEARYLANFALSLVPDESQLGKNALILSDLQMHALDSYTGTELSNYLNNLDTSLPADRLNAGNGVVIE